MQRSWVFIGLLGYTWAAAAQAPTETGQATKPPDPNPTAKLAEAHNQFAAALLKAQPSNQGVFFSPYSIHQALTMLYVGARGETKSQLARLLAVDPADDGWLSANAGLCSRLKAAANGDGSLLSIANVLMPAQQNPVKPEYLTAAAAAVAGSAVVPFDSANPEAARSSVNQWASQQTERIIREVVPAGGLSDPRTQLVLANAVYFKAAWAEPFKPRQTQPGPFRCLDGTTVTAPYMHEDRSMDYGKGPGWQAVAKDYKSNGARAVVVLPDAGPMPALPLWSEVRAALDLASVDLWLPRFGGTADFPLKQTLNSLGCGVLFDQAKADLSGISGATGFALLETWHKAFVRVDEKGTVAAAVTAGGGGYAGGSFQRLRLVVDRPFYFVIEDSATGTILFLGRIAAPEQLPTNR